MKKGRLKNLIYEEIKGEILGKAYDLSIVLVSSTKIKSLNSKYRKKNEGTDVLSFALDENMGEIFICPEVAKLKSKKFLDPLSSKIAKKVITFENYLLFLVIHACLHLKGLEHGVKMERYELAHYNRNRRRHL